MGDVNELDYVLMAGRAYESTRISQDNWFPVKKEWKKIAGSHRALGSSGFEAISFSRGTPTTENQGEGCDIVISYAGTGPGSVISQPDWWANYDLATGSCCDQLRQAAAYYLMIKC